MNYYNEIKENLLKSELYDRVKDYAKDRNKVKVYYETGKLLHEAGKEYGKNIIKMYSDKLVIEVGKKYNERNLRYMRQFYELFSSLNWNPIGSDLNWSHYRELLILSDKYEILYYIDLVYKRNLTKNGLHNAIKNNEYKRLPSNTKIKINNDDILDVSDTIPNPIIIKNYKENDKFSEYVLKESILNNLDEFLLQLGYGFCYVGNEYKIKYNNIYNYIDLLLYNIEYNCYAVIELKKGKLKKEHIGQIQTYMNYIDKNLKKDYQNKTIGIIICQKENKFVIEYTSDDRITVREYKLM